MFNIITAQAEKYIIEMRKVFNDIDKKIISEKIPDDIGLWLYFNNSNYREVMSYRENYIRKVGFSRVSKNWVRPLARWIGDRKCLEIMAGSGAITYALREEGIKIKATDNFSWSQPFRQWTQVENMDCIEAIEKYGKEVSFIICSWPYMDDTAYRALLKIREVNPKCRMIYIGEWCGGCTADDGFFSEIKVEEVKGFDDAVKNYSRWYSIHDYPYLVK